MSTEKAVVKVKKNEVNTSVVFEDMLMGACADIDTEDIVIEKIILMQAISTLVGEDKATAGEYRTSKENKLLATKNKSLDFIVLDAYKSWQVFKNSAKEGAPAKWDYVETLDYKENPLLEVNEVLDGVEYHRDKVLGFYVLLLDEIKEGNAFPYIIDFKRTGRPTGQQLATNIQKLRQQNLPACAKVFSLSADFQKGDKGSYYVKKVSTGRNIKQDELEVVKNWVMQLREAKQKGTVKVDNSDIKEDVVEVKPTRGF